MPSAETILILLILIVAVLTWILPAGQYSYLPDGAPIAGSYTQVSRSGQSIWAVTRAPLLPVMIAAGYDTVTAVSVILLGAGAGVLGSTVNPFATGIAAGFAGTGMGQGIGLRLLILLLGLAMSIGYVLYYGQRVKNDPGRSLVLAQREENLRHFALKNQTEAKLTGTQKLALWLFGGTFLVMIYGVIPVRRIFWVSHLLLAYPEALR